MTLYHYQFRHETHATILDVTPMPDWQDFDEFVQQFLQQQQAQMIEQDVGMDRHQVRYRIGAKQYVLQFEHYSNAIWIEQDY